MAVIGAIPYKQLSITRLQLNYSLLIGAIPHKKLSIKNL